MAPILVTPIKKSKVEMNTLDEIHDQLKETIIKEWQIRPIVYIIVVKIDNQEYLKIGCANRFFTTINRNSKKLKTQRYHSIIYDLRNKGFEYVKISKILTFIGEVIDDEGELTIRDIESELLKITENHKVDIKNLKEYRQYNDEVLDMIKNHIQKQNLPHFSTKMI